MLNSQAAAAQLEASLGSLDGFKKIMKPFLFFFGGPKPGFEFWSGASVRKVVTNHRLAEYQHEDNFYQIMAFNIQNDIVGDELAELRARAGHFYLGRVRYESSMASSAEKLLVFDFEDEDRNDIFSMSDPVSGLFVFPRPTEKAGQSFPLALYAVSEGKRHYYPIKAEYLG